MIIDMDVKADSTQIQVVVPQADLSWNLANIVAYNVSNDSIIDIGESEDDIEKQVFERGNRELWESKKSQVGFTAPFAVDTFHPEFAEKIVWYCTSKTHKAMRRGIQGLFDKFNYHLQIAEYENVSCSKREDFAYLLYKHLKPRLLVINGETFDPRPYKMSELSLRLFRWIAILFVLVITFIFRLSVTEVGESWWQIVLLGIAYISMSVGLVYGFPLLWVTVMRNFLPNRALEVLLSTFRLPKRFLDRLHTMLQRAETGENHENG